MSYEFGPHNGYKGTTHTLDFGNPQYETYPLGQLAPAAPMTTGFSLANINLRQVIMAIVVVIVVALVMRELMKRMKGSPRLERNAVVSRLSTKELATRLYDRLDKKGRANPATMRSLERLGR